MEGENLSDDDDELVYILNLDEVNVLLLPSPIDERHSQRQTRLKMIVVIVIFVATYFCQ